jgi:hypothetical protein
MATEAQIRAGIIALVEGVSDVGVVHDYIRFTANWSDFLDFFKTTIDGQAQIRGWMLTMERMPNQKMTGGSSALHRRLYHYRLRGYMGLDDSAETEKTFLAIALAIIQELEQYPLLNGVLSNGTFEDWPYIEFFEARTFGGAVCHHAEIAFTVYHKDTVTYQE